MIDSDGWLYRFTSALCDLFDVALFFLVAFAVATTVGLLFGWLGSP